MRRHKHLLLGLFAVWAVESGTAVADEPGWEIEDYLNSTILTIRIYTIPTHRFRSFVDTAVSTGPFTSQFGGFVNEKILEPISTSDTGFMEVIVLSRYFDKGTADMVNQKRDPYLRGMSESDPVTINATLVEHNFGNWRWEGGASASAVGLASAKPYDTRRIMDNQDLSVSFGKAGYVGQVGLLESYSSSANVASIRKELSTRSDIAGASIFKADGGYVVYSEYFRTSDRLAGKSLSVASRGNERGDGWFTGGHLGVVSSNYGNR